MKSKRIAALLLSLLMALTVIPFSTINVAAAAPKSAAQISAKASHKPLATDKYYQYSKLNATQKKAYTAINDGIIAFKNTINLSKYKLKQEDAYILIQKVLADHPEYFYVANDYSVTLDGKTKKVKDAILLFTDGKKTDTIDKKYKPVVKANRKTISSQIAAVNKKANEIVASIPVNDSQLAKEKYIHDYLTANIAYNYAALNNSASASSHVWEIYGALVEKSAVCEGYAKSFVYLCHRVGINATIVMGKDHTGGDHMWNAVEIDKSWYLVDLTWDDNDAKELPTIYQYFNVTSLEMGKDHYVDSKLSCPSCTDTRNAYKSLCINLENNKLPSNYKTILDNVVKNQETAIPLYKGKDGKLDVNLVSKLFVSPDSAVQKYIKQKGYPVKIEPQTIQYGNYMFLRLQYTGTVSKHSFKTVVTPATLSKDGKIVKKCAICGTVDSTSAIKRAKTFTLSATSYTYDGKVKSPSVTVKDAAGKTLKKNTDYTVTYASGRKNVGTYKVTIKMKGNYSGTKTLTFKVNPPKTTVSKATSTKAKTLHVTVAKKTTQTTGYQIQYATSKLFKSAKSVTLSNKTTAKTITGLKAKTTYYVRVRTYKKVGSTTYYSGWSTVKSATIKK